MKPTERYPSLAKNLRGISLKKDHRVRPLWTLPNGVVLLEATSRLYPVAYDFLISVAEPRSRPKYIHQYQLTPYSLLAAVSLDLSAEMIIGVLNKLSKNEVPKKVVDYVRECTKNFGKAKIVLKRNRLFIEATESETLDRLLKHDEIRKARVERNMDMNRFSVDTAPTAVAHHYDAIKFDTDGAEVEADSDIAFLLKADDIDLQKVSDIDGVHGEVDLDISTSTKQAYNFEIKPVEIEAVKRAALSIDFPLLEEYDFQKDTFSATLEIGLKDEVHIRRYQSKSLSKMFANGRARSGLIVLPCGAGKTLTGIVACCTIKKSCVILCTSAVAVKQWQEQLHLFTNIQAKTICCFTSKEKDDIPAVSEACVLITTYNMLAIDEGRRSDESAYVVGRMKGREWGLLVCDEVHVVPARLFRRVCTKLKAHCKLGLSATLVREDNLISDLNFLIGPKLYEANWMDLTRQGYLANVSCNEVWCPMTREFFKEYLSCKRRAGIGNPENDVKGGSQQHLRQLLCVLNPNKILACEYLVNYHESRGDRILVFCDNIFALTELEKRIRRKVIHGKTSEQDRIKILTAFKNNLSRTSGTVIISKVGDVAINLPSANVLIQVSSHFGSRRQEAQRLGRILRPKSKVLQAIEDEEDETRYNAYFYSLISEDTEEAYFSDKRRQYLLENGYSFKVIKDLYQQVKSEKQPEDTDSFFYGDSFAALRSKDEQLTLLARILTKGKLSLAGMKRKSVDAMPWEVSDDDENVPRAVENDRENLDLELSLEKRVPAATHIKRRKVVYDTDSDSEVDEASLTALANIKEKRIEDVTGAANLEYLEYERSDR